jgi:hypothetical protein
MYLDVGFLKDSKLLPVGAECYIHTHFKVLFGNNCHVSTSTVVAWPSLAMSES